MNLTDIPGAIERFMESGGPVMFWIAILTFVLWTLIYERWLYFRSAVKKDLESAVSVWVARSDHHSWHSLQIRRLLVSQAQEKLNQGFSMIKTLIAVCPLLGLLGTVSGMIEVFNIMAVTGGGDARAMAGGVSQATIPTMSGMVVALSGMFGMTYIRRLADKHSEELEDRLAPTLN